VAQGVREREISMDLKTKIMALVKEGWARNRPPGGVGTTDSVTIYTRLLAEGVDVSPGAMARILEDLSAEGKITTGPEAFDREGRQPTRCHGNHRTREEVVTYPGGTKPLVAQADTEVTERCKKSAKSAQRRWPKN
jgi:hypothetical protein